MPSHPCVQLCQVHAQHKACWALGQLCARVAGVGHRAEMACSQLSGKVTSFLRAFGLTKAQVIPWGIWRESFLRQFLSIFLSFPCHGMNKSWSIWGKGEQRGSISAYLLQGSPPGSFCSFLTCAVAGAWGISPLFFFFPLLWPGDQFLRKSPVASRNHYCKIMWCAFSCLNIQKQTCRLTIL